MDAGRTNSASLAFMKSTEVFYIDVTSHA